MVTSHPAQTPPEALAQAGDLGPLAWVLDETRKSLGSATKSLKRFAYASESARGVDLASVDASQLRMARQQLHQVVGALDMVGQSIAARMVRGMEAAVQQFVLHPEKCTELAATTLERAGFALVEYLESQLSGRPRSALGLFPLYNQVQEMAGTERVAPSELWEGGWRWVEVPAPVAAQPLAYDLSVRGRFDQRVLKIMRHGDANAAMELSVVCLGLGDGEASRRAAVFWRLAAGFFEALGAGYLKMDVHAKRAASGVLMQYSSLAQGDPSLSERLARDLLFFCALARVPGDAPTPTPTPALVAVRQAWGLGSQAAGSYDEQSFGLYDPAALAQARRRVESVKESWSALAGGDMARLKACVDQFALVSESLDSLHERGKPLSEALSRVAAQVAQSGRPPSPELAMETATAVLFLEASFADFQPADPMFNARTLQLAERLDTVRGGGVAPALETWMEELYRAVSDRHTMGTVVGELRATLGEVEQHLDQFFREPTDKAQLSDVPALMGQIRGVLSVLGLDQAALAIGRMRDSVEDLLVTEVDPERVRISGTFDKLGNSLGALGFLIDMLGYQPVLARKLFVFDTQSGELRHLAGRSVVAPVDVPADFADQATAIKGSDSAFPPTDFDRPDMLSAPPELAPGAPAAEVEPLMDFDGAWQTAELPPSAEPARTPVVAQTDAREVDASAPVVPAVAAEPALSLEAAPDEDDELLDIFLEEAREVATTAALAIGHLAHAPSDLEQQTTLRRAFHTLKGSSRMVGLTEFGEAAWAMEQLLNAWLAEQKPVTEEVRGLASEALQNLTRWIEDIAARTDAHWRAAPFRAAADALRLHGRRNPLMPEGAAAAALAEPPAAATDEATLPGALDAPQVPEAPVATAQSFAMPEMPDLDLSQESFDDLSEAALASESGSAEFLAGDAVAPELDLSLDLAAADWDTPAELPSVEVTDMDWDEASRLAEFTPAPVPAATPAPQAVEVVLPDLELSLDDDAAAPATEPMEEVGAPTEPGVSADTSFAPEAAATPDVSSGEGAAALPSDAADAAPPAEAAAVPDEATTSPPEEDDLFKQIGDLRISTPLYNVYLNEADEWSRRLVADLADWATDVRQPVPDSAIARAHSLAGSSATVGLRGLSGLARAVEHALERLSGQGEGSAEQARVLQSAADDMRRVLHQFAVGTLKSPNAAVTAAVHALEPSVPGVASATEPSSFDDEAEFFMTQVAVDLDMPPMERAVVPAPSAFAPLESTPEQAPTVVPPVQTISDAPEHAFADDIDVEDVVDADLFPIFEEEAEELLPRLDNSMRQWAANPDNRAPRGEVLRVLHTLKGSARLAGALRLGEMAHRTESAIETIGSERVGAEDLEPVLDHVDELQSAFRSLQRRAVSDAQTALAAAEAAASAPQQVPETDEPEHGDALQPDEDTPAATDVAPVPRGTVALPAPLSLVTARAAASQAVRVRSQLLDRLVTQAGEVMTSRARLESEVGQLRGSLTELTSNLERLRQQLRDVELQAETQMQSRLALSRDAQQNFDPLEFDRFTRMQELTRMMAESVNDVATVQRSLQRAVDASEGDLAAQARQSRELQRDLLRTRMVEFEGISERLYRVVRQASKETGKQVRLDISGGSIEMDRGILDRMTPAFEHLLRNCVVHGIEAQGLRTERGKDPAGVVTIDVAQAGNDVSVEFRDDGGGLDLRRIRERAQEQGLIGAGQVLDDVALANLIFSPGFTTVTEVTELAGRGVGMDVVRTEVQALGGRIELQTAEARGSSFRLVLPLTTAVTHVVLIRTGQLVIGVPSNLVELVHRASAKDLQLAYNSGAYPHGGDPVRFFWSGALLQSSGRSSEPQGRTTPVVVFRSADQRIALHVDEVLGNQEVVVRALGAQLSRLPGLVAMTALASGAVTLIYNPVALAAVYGEQARALSADRAQPEVLGQGATPAGQGTPAVPAVPTRQSDIPLVLVVDDSITVRRVTQRLLQREGYRVALAADGLQGLERLQLERPAVVLSDIEMPRMDGFDFVRNIRADAELRDLPVIMITSRIAEKHREHARELGVSHYLGKPYSEDELLALIKTYAQVTGADVSS